MTEPHRREFDLSLTLVTPTVPEESYRVVGGTYRSDDGPQRRYDAYLPEPMPTRPPPVVILVHGDGPPEFLQEPRLWGQYRSWGALIAANGMAAIAFDHRSTEGRTRMHRVVAEIRELIATVTRAGGRLGMDASRLCMWSGSAGVPFGFIAALDQPAVRCRVAFYGPMDLRMDHPRTAATASSTHLVEYSPIIHLDRRRGAIAPLFIAKAGLDRPAINDSIDAFATLPAELRSSVQVETHPDGRHASDVLDEDSRSREIIESAVGFMRQHLG